MKHIFTYQPSSTSTLWKVTLVHTDMVIIPVNEETEQNQIWGLFPGGKRSLAMTVVAHHLLPTLLVLL